MRFIFVIPLTIVFGWAAGSQAASSEQPHALIHVRHADTAVSKSLTDYRSESIIPLQVPADPRRLCGTVFGYLPYWESADYLRYDLLTHLACFSVEVNPDGSLGNDHGWPWTPVINAAHAEGVKVILVATLFDADDILTLITSPSYKANFFANIRNKMLEGSADGLNIDFEGSGTWRSQIHVFMAELTAYLHVEIPGCEVTFAGPAVNWSDAFDLEALADSCDGIFIMGYSFAGSWSTHTGPNAPLTGGSINITDTVLDEYSDVTQNNPEKLILGVPYYGRHWIAVSSEPRAAVVGNIVGSTFFEDDQPNSELYGLLWESLSQTPWYCWHDGQNWHQVWFDNAESIGLKYELARDNRLAGVGVWALGYDGDRDELWDVLDFWYGNGCFAASDFDNDHDVDQGDFGRFQACLSGSNVPQTDPACQLTLLDLDDDVDEDDFAIFQSCVSGPNLPPSDYCVPSLSPAPAIPPRSSEAVTGSAFIAEVSDLPLSNREARIAAEVTTGNVPEFLRTFVPVTVTMVINRVPHTATFEVMPDYLCVGSDVDFVRMPMTPETAQTIADRFNCILPTRKMVDLIYDQAAVKLAPSPISPATTDITAVSTFYEHHLTIETQRAGNPLGLLVGGIKKDVVITPQLVSNPGKVAIYGWHQLDGSPIQPLYLGHIDWYVDYSHGIRLVKDEMVLDGNPASVAEVLGDAAMSHLLSDEGVVTNPRY